MRSTFFQRYHTKENVITNNVLQLLTQVKKHKPQIFNDILQYFMQNQYPVDFDTLMTMQDRLDTSIPDAIISQPSYKIVVETKIGTDFRNDQIRGHLDAFQNEDYQILLTIDSRELSRQHQMEFDGIIRRFNFEQGTHVKHAHVTFANIITCISQLLTERDEFLNEILDDFKEMIIAEGLYASSEYSMLAVACNTTYDYVISGNVYHRPVDKEELDFRYLGLSNNRSIRQIGEIEHVIELTPTEQGDRVRLIYSQEYTPGDMADESFYDLIDAIQLDIKQSQLVIDQPMRFYFVKDWYATDFPSKETWIQRTKYFDFTQLIDETSQTSPIEQITSLIHNKTWEDVF